MSDYPVVPNLFQIEHYDECFAGETKFSRSAYCIADAFIKPNVTSEIWDFIDKISHPWKTQYRHDHLVYGICINKCKELMKKIDAMTQREYFLPTPKNHFELNSNNYSFNYIVEDENEFDQIVNECINYVLRQKYQISAYSRIQYCDIKGRSEEIGKIIISCKIYHDFYS